MVFKVGDKVLAHVDIKTQGKPPVVRTNGGVVVAISTSALFTLTTVYEVAFNSTVPEAKGFPVVISGVRDHQITPSPDYSRTSAMTAPFALRRTCQHSSRLGRWLPRAVFTRQPGRSLKFTGFWPNCESAGSGRPRPVA